MNEARSAVAPVKTLILATPRRLGLRVHVGLNQHQRTSASNPKNDSPRAIPEGDFYHSQGLRQRSARYPWSPSPLNRPNSEGVVYQAPALGLNRAKNV